MKVFVKQHLTENQRRFITHSRILTLCADVIICPILSTSSSNFGIWYLFFETIIFSVSESMASFMDPSRDNNQNGT